jgi:riboflavin kinase/FMN adenylyltransferase
LPPCPREFVEDILIRKIGMVAIVVGKDYTFGNNREGTVDLLKTYADELFDFDVIWPTGSAPKEIPTASAAPHPGWSWKAKMEKVQDARPQLSDPRHRGSRKDRGGRLLGIPTANIILHDELCPKVGVYAVIVAYDGKQYRRGRQHRLQPYLRRPLVHRRGTHSRF